ncbi:FO synthase subunit 1 [Durusdinium trenchii]|uniref:FO synthase subunit 1 n=1 Tax=Durusdinium trenchii TaxID=1381693 RepID=A0ABP0N995_9DINO
MPVANDVAELSGDSADDASADVHEGTRRFEKMVKAAEAGYVNAPVDLRYISKPMSKNPSEATASVASFLSSMYQSVAETLPDIRDEACDFEIETTLAAPEDETDKVDPYGDSILRSTTTRPAVKTRAPRKDKVKKVRKFQKSIKVDLARKPELGGLHEERYLPPGSLKEIWEQYKVLNTPAASFVTFYRVAG